MPHRVTELHNIMPIGNVPLVMQHGLLSYESAARLEHRSVAMPHIQERRDQVQVPGGLRLHQYANLYFHARNPMMFVRKDQHESLCVLMVSPEVFNLPGVVLTDQNAASKYVRFLSPQQLTLLPFAAIYALDWTHSDQITYWRQKSAKCAEVLVPGAVPPALIMGAYVSGQAGRDAMLAKGWNRPLTIDPPLFFQEAQE